MANVITGVRIVCALSLIFCPMFSAWFYGLYILGGVSNVLDGMAARRLGTETKFGAQLDTVADILFSAVVILKVMRAVSVPTWLILCIVCIAAVKCCNVICSFVLYKRLVSEHTVMNKTCGALLFALPICIGLFPRQLSVILSILTCAAAAFAAIQEGHYIRTGKEIR